MEHARVRRGAGIGQTASCWTCRDLLGLCEAALAATMEDKVRMSVVTPTPPPPVVPCSHAELVLRAAVVARVLLLDGVLRTV
jgi:hypothetical protein